MSVGGSAERRPSLVLGVAGGSASGKSAVVHRVTRLLGSDAVAVVPHDAYYRDLSHLTMTERRQVNVDHPDALQTDLLVEHLDRLLQGRAIERPVYDFSTHVRASSPVTVRPAPVLIVEGILVLAEEVLRKRMDLKVFVDVPERVRLERRLERDVRLRGRTPESVRHDHETRVEPMHARFVEPSREHADVVITGGGRNVEAIRKLVARIEAILE